MTALPWKMKVVEPVALRPEPGVDMHGVVGDEILIVSPGHSSGSPDRRGTIRAVLGEPGREHYRVCWPDGRESVVPSGIVKLAAGPHEAPIGAARRGRRSGDARPTGPHVTRRVPAPAP